MDSARLTPTIMSARFFASSRYAVVGASTDRAKFGNKVLRWYQAHGLPVSPINPTQSEIEGLPAFKSISDLPSPFADLSISIITPPHISLAVVREALALGVHSIWLQPGAEDDAVRRLVKEEKAEDWVTLGGPCILVLGGGLLDAQRAASGGKL